MKLSRLASTAAALAVAGTAVVGVAVPAAVASTITQSYSCSVPIVGTETASVTVSGTATLNSTTKVISMAGVKFKVTNPTSDTIKADKIIIQVPEPNATSAPFKSGTAKVAKTPAGWTAGGSSSYVYAEHAGTLTIKGGGTVTNAALSAKYADKGPAGTTISFKPGDVTFDLTSPISGTVTCTPTSPVGTFASVTE